jgi:hypothetical protein
MRTGRRYGVFIAPSPHVDPIEQDEFDTLAEANALARALLERAQARFGGRVRRFSASPLRAILYDGRHDPVRFSVERVEPGAGMIRYRRPRRSRA